LSTISFNYDTGTYSVNNVVKHSYFDSVNVKVVKMVVYQNRLPIFENRLPLPLPL